MEKFLKNYKKYEKINGKNKGITEIVDCLEKVNHGGFRGGIKEIKEMVNSRINGGPISSKNDRFLRFTNSIVMPESVVRKITENIESMEEGAAYLCYFQVLSNADFYNTIKDKKTLGTEEMAPNENTKMSSWELFKVMYMALCCAKQINKETLEFTGVLKQDDKIIISQFESSHYLIKYDIFKGPSFMTPYNCKDYFKYIYALKEDCFDPECMKHLESELFSCAFNVAYDNGLKLNFMVNMQMMKSVFAFMAENNL